MKLKLFTCKPYGCRLTRESCAKRFRRAETQHAAAHPAGDMTGGGLTANETRHCVGCGDGQNNLRLYDGLKGYKPSLGPGLKRWDRTAIGRTLAQLKKHGEPVHVSDVPDLVGMCRSSVSSALARLRDKGLVTQLGNGFWQAKEANHG